MGSAKDKVAGKANELAGKAKQAAGDATDNNSLRAKGAAQKAKGGAQQTKGKLKDAVKDAVDRLKALKLRFVRTSSCPAGTGFSCEQRKAPPSVCPRGQATHRYAG